MVRYALANTAAPMAVANYSAQPGINLALAQRFGELGAAVAILSRSPERIAAAAADLRSRGYSCLGVAADVRDSDAVKGAFEQTAASFGKVDVVVSGAAGNFLAPAVDLSPNGFKTVVDIDLVGTFNVLRTSWDYLVKPGASLISITAPQAVRPTVKQAHACAAKAGINMLTKVLAIEWGPAGVRVNAISPGFIEGTEGTSRIAEDIDGITAEVPLRRLGHKGEIADAAVFLSSPSANYITGTILDCDGGFVLGPSAVHD